jgi:hypothetical protein
MSTRLSWIPRLVVAPTYSDYFRMFANKTCKSYVTLGQEWEHTPYFEPALHDNSIVSMYVYANMLRRWDDASGPKEGEVPPVVFYCDGEYNIEAVLRQSAWMAVLGYPLDECQRCGRHVHLGGDSVYSAYNLNVKRLHDYMGAMAHKWLYTRGRFRFVYRSALEAFARRNEFITSEHYDAINYNRGDGHKAATVEIRYGETLPAISLPAIIYAVEYIFKRNFETVQSVDPHSDEYFDTAIKLCNNPLCAEIIRSVRDYVVERGSVKWTWYDVRVALDHILDNYVYDMLDIIEDFADRKPEVFKYATDYLVGFVVRRCDSMMCVKRLKSMYFAELLECIIGGLC